MPEVVEIDGVAIVQIEILDRAANEGLQSVEGGSGVFSVNHVSGSASRKELGEPLGVGGVIWDEIAKEVAEPEEGPKIFLGHRERQSEEVRTPCRVVADSRSVGNKPEELDVRAAEVTFCALKNNVVAF